MESLLEMQIVEKNEHLIYKKPVSCLAASNIVTVIIQCYNRTTFLDETVKSVCGQTFTGYDVIVFDNGSCPERANDIETIAGRYQAGYLRAFRNGHGDNIRRLVLPLLTTKYIAIIHDDDKWKAEKLADSIAILEKDGLDFVFSNKQYIDQNGAIIPSVDFVDAAISDYNYEILSPELVVEVGLFRSNVLHWSSLVIRREVLWREFARYACFSRIGDWMFFCHLVLSDELKGRFLEARDTLVRIHGSNDFSYLKFSPIKRVMARTRLVNDEIHFFQEVLAYSGPKFKRIFQKYLQGDHGAECYNRCYVDLSFRVSEWPSPSWIHFSKACFLKAVELDPVDTHNYLFSRYQTFGDDYVSQLDTTFFVRNMALCIGFLPDWMINLAITVVHLMNRLRGNNEYLPPIGQSQVRKSPKATPTV